MGWSHCRPHPRTLTPNTRQPQGEGAAPRHTGALALGSRPPGSLLLLRPPSAHPSHRPAQPSPLGRCSGLRQGHRCPGSGRGRNADSPHRRGPRDRLGTEREVTCSIPASQAGDLSPRRASPLDLQARPKGQGPRAASRTTCSTAPRAHLPSLGGLRAEGCGPKPSSPPQVPHGRGMGPALPVLHSQGAVCPPRAPHHVTLHGPGRGKHVAWPQTPGQGLPCRQVGPIQPGPQRHCPWTGSQEAPLKQEQAWLQLWPYVWAGQAAGERGGQGPGGRTPGGAAADGPRLLWSICPSLWPGHQSGWPQIRTDPNPNGQHPGLMGTSRTLGTAGAPAASRAEAGAVRGVAGHPGAAVTGVVAVHSKEAGRAGCRQGAVMGDGQGSWVPTHTPGHPGLHPGSPRSQKVPLQPAGQVQAPLTWSQAAPCSHWHCRPQPGPK